MPYLYVLFSEKDGQWYIGQTLREITDRFSEHQRGYVKATRARRPLHLAYAKQFNQVKDAKKLEWHLKQPSGYQEKIRMVSLLLKRRAEWPVAEL